MQNIYLSFLILLTSCAHHYKDSNHWASKPTKPISAKISKDFKVNSHWHGDPKDQVEYTKKYILSNLVELHDSNSKEAQMEILSLDIENEGLGPRCGNGYPGLLILFTLTLGIVPVMATTQFEGTLTYRDLKTQQIRTVELDAEHTQGMGWLYWIRAWTSDEWKWTSEIEDQYPPGAPRTYFKDYARWAIESDIAERAD